MLSPIITRCPLDMSMVVAGQIVAPRTRCERLIMRLIHTTADQRGHREQAVHTSHTGPQPARKANHMTPTCPLHNPLLYAWEVHSGGFHEEDFTSSLHTNEHSQNPFTEPRTAETHVHGRRSRTPES